MAFDKALEPFAPDEGDQPIEIEIGEDTSVEDVAPAAPPGHRDNLANYLDESDLQKLGSDLVSCFEDDEASRREWLETKGNLAEVIP